MAHVASSTKVLILVINDEIEPVLSRVAEERGWSLVHFRTAAQAVKHIQFNLPELFVVQVLRSADQTLQLIRGLRSHLQRVPLLAVAFSDDQTIELSVRQAGAYCFLSDAADPEPLAQMVAAMLKHP